MSEELDRKTKYVWVLMTDNGCLFDAFRTLKDAKTWLFNYCHDDYKRATVACEKYAYMDKYHGHMMYIEKLEVK